MQLDKARLFDRISSLTGGVDHLCVAVSGGSDSLALAFLLNEWAENKQVQITSLSVNHGLRPQAALECEQVRQILEKQTRIRPITLTHEGLAPKKDIQAQARVIRYDLMTRWCQENGVNALFLAHHMDDQAETFLLRLARGSGVDGLSAMQQKTKRNGIYLLRPLLDVSRTDLQSYLKGWTENWIKDPSNEDKRFDRVKLRALSGTLAEIGIDSARLVKTAQAMSRARACLESLTDDWIKHAVCPYEEGYVYFDYAKWASLPEELRLRALVRIAQAVSGEAYPGRLDGLERVVHSLFHLKSTTYRGCRWIVEKGRVLVCPEVRHSLHPKTPSALWQGRVILENYNALQGFQVRALGDDGWVQVLKNDPGKKQYNLPHPVVLGLISLWKADTVLSVPHLGYKGEIDPTLHEAFCTLRCNLEERLFS